MSQKTPPRRGMGRARRATPAVDPRHVALAAVAAALLLAALLVGWRFVNPGTEGTWNTEPISVAFSPPRNPADAHYLLPDDDRVRIVSTMELILAESPAIGGRERTLYTGGGMAHLDSFFPYRANLEDALEDPNNGNAWVFRQGKLVRVDTLQNGERFTARRVFYNQNLAPIFVVGYNEHGEQGPYYFGEYDSAGLLRRVTLFLNNRQLSSLHLFVYRDGYADSDRYHFSASGDLLFAYFVEGGERRQYDGRKDRSRKATASSRYSNITRWQRQHDLEPIYPLEAGHTVAPPPEPRPPSTASPPRVLTDVEEKTPRPFYDDIEPTRHTELSLHEILAEKPLTTREQIAEMRWLLKRGANPNSVNDDGQALLHVTAKSNGLTGIALLLMDHGADVMPRDRYHRTPLHVAAVNKNVGGMRRLLERGADIEARDNREKTPLHYAVRPRSTAAGAAFLLGQGADIEARTDDGQTPLHVAARILRGDAMEELLTRNADITARDNDGGTAMVHVGREYTATKNDGRLEKAKRVVEILVRNGADVNEADDQGRTLLHYTAERGSIASPEFLTFLLELGADPELVDKGGTRAIDLARKRGKDELTDVLERADR